MFSNMDTRWRDNDVYGHVNNIEYYGYMDTAVNSFLLSEGILNLSSGDHISLVAETGCSYFSPIAFPDRIDVGLRVSSITRSSVTWSIGIFKQGEEKTAALGRFVHVNVDRATRVSTPFRDAHRAVLEKLR